MCGNGQEKAALQEGGFTSQWVGQCRALFTCL